MFRDQCGNKVSDDSIFCSKCGKKIDVHQDSVNEQAAVSETILFEPSPRERQKNLLTAFVGKNAHFYTHKWQQSKSPFSPSWNWASFFLTPFWLGYRKMYGQLAIYWAISILITLPFMDSDIISSLLGIMLCIIYGLYGNQLYYLKASKAVRKVDALSLDEKASAYALSKMGGGTSTAGVFLSIGYFLVAVVIFGFAYFFVMSGEVIFGTGEDEIGITGVSDTFNKGDDIFYEADFGRAVGKTTIEVLLIKTENGNEEIYYEWEEKVSPDWDATFNLVDGEDDGDPDLERGHYILRVTDEKDIISEGEFSIK